ncbi:MAG: PEGA domain-containing protein, partial [Candidatus Latescibacteria bacterium]|nr:PEGA domain-containing protein [Candidatus Latescibacterota bacterium]
ESVAAREGAASQNLAVVRINSVPENAEIEIDGAFSGSTPRKYILSPLFLKEKSRGLKSFFVKPTIAIVGVG